MFGKTYFLILLLFALALPARAGYQFFKVPVKESTWVVKATPLICRLRHSIPDYGYAEFVRRVKAELEFSVHVKQAANRPESARLLSRAPEWKHIAIARDFGSIPVVKGKEPFYLHNGWAKRMATELAEGMDLQLVYRDWSDGSDEITVTVIPVNFLEAWSKFQTCEKQLLHFNFADVRKTIIQYGVGKTRLDRATQHRLDQMIHYMKIDSSVRGVRIDGYTDSKGLQRINIVVARRRANTVRNYFIKHGISRNKIRVHAHSELDGKFSNRTAAGRKKNRRVEVRLVH
ncbi:hypothetical protein MNBD_GAMMA24-1307 [hydrothermal vent metagenome]|uniref:OmpA-like domain-containing protein n=1 Tax=hydrothermal vent metagenome TaxID=652676 RepID=A0A3B1B766_9ZZZZ